MSIAATAGLRCRGDLLDRIALRQDQLDSAETMDSQREQSDLGETRSILVFRLGEEFGLATGRPGGSGADEPYPFPAAPALARPCR